MIRYHNTKIIYIMGPKRRRKNVLHYLLNDPIKTDCDPINQDIPNISHATSKSIYLSFDVATKSLAFSVVKLPTDIPKEFNQIRNQIEEITEESQIQAIHDRVKSFITIMDGSVDNLVPDKKDKDISEVERLRALIGYYKTKLLPMMTIHELTPENTVILIEYQMSPNFKARTICSGLITLLYEYEIHIVKPILKNRINLTPDGHWINFVKKYKTLYTANKKHAIYNFEWMIQRFTIAENLKFTKTQISHVADAFMQTIGFVKFTILGNKM